MAPRSGLLSAVALVVVALTAVGVALAVLGFAALLVAFAPGGGREMPSSAHGRSGTGVSSGS
jgi:hypothetical protein